MQMNSQSFYFSFNNLLGLPQLLKTTGYLAKP